MFYEPNRNNHGLKYNPYKSIVVPRPIGWISTLSRDGVRNLAPYSQFNNLGFDPPYLMFSGSTGENSARKDTARNIIETGEFVVNVATYELREAVHITSRGVPPDVDEAELAGLTMIPSNLVKPYRVKESPIHLECEYFSSIICPGRTPSDSHEVVIGRVIGVHIRDDVLTPEGKIDVLKVRPLARLGYFDYTSVESVFSMAPEGERARAGMEGRPRDLQETS